MVNKQQQTEILNLLNSVLDLVQGLDMGCGETAEVQDISALAEKYIIVDKLK